MAETTKTQEKFTEKHKGIWQFIKFTLISSVAGASELISFLLLNSLILVSLNSTPFHWWIFDYSDVASGVGLGSMLAFLISTTIGNGISFIMNRKATFKADNNVALSVSLYVILIVIIICLQTYFGPIVTEQLTKLISNEDIAGTISKMAMMFCTFLIIFPMNKYVIMRKSDEKKA